MAAAEAAHAEMTDMTDEPLALGAERRFSIAGRVALVTGAAHGLGLGMASAFVSGGAKVALIDVDREALAAAERRLSEHGNVIAVHADVRDDVAVRSAVEATHTAFSRLDIVVNNAAIHEIQSLAEMDAAVSLDAMNVNTVGYLRVIAAARPHLVASRAGRVINIASITFYLGMPRLGAYVASKGAVIGLTRVLARELGPSGVTVNAIAPGAFPTRVEETAPAGWEESVLAAQSIKRRGHVGDVAAAAMFLASDAASFVTGQTISVDGGWTQH